jgi:hypothetical protein
MAVGTVPKIKLSASDRSRSCRPLNEPKNIRYIIRIHIEKPRLSIEGSTTPLAAAIRTREDHSPLETEWCELAFVANISQALYNGFMHLRRPLGHHLFSENLSRKRGRLRWKRLSLRQDFSFDVRLWDAAIFDGK